jgi:hypothetical protein
MGLSPVLLVLGEAMLSNRGGGLGQQAQGEEDQCEKDIEQTEAALGPPRQSVCGAVGRHDPA